MNRLLPMLAASALLSTGLAAEAGTATPPATEPAATLPTLWLAGDSTVKVSTAGQVGWGERLGAFLDATKVQLENRAIGGRSTRTFLNEGRWQAIVEALRPGDMVLVQFGHNDSSPVNDNHRARGTLRGIGEETEDIVNMITGQPETVHTYGWYLRKFVREVKAAGATPILCSPVPRNNWDDGKVRRTHDTWAGWARQVAEAEGVGLVDLAEIIARGYEAAGPAFVDSLFGGDHTHTNEAGAYFGAAAVVAGLKALPNNPAGGIWSGLGAAVPPYRE